MGQFSVVVRLCGADLCFDHIVDEKDGEHMSVIMAAIKVKKWAHTLMLWESIGHITLDGQQHQVGMAVNGTAVFIHFPEGHYVVEIGEVVSAIAQYRHEHKDDPADDEKKPEPEKGGKNDG